LQIKSPGNGLETSDRQAHRGITLVNFLLLKEQAMIPHRIVKENQLAALDAFHRSALLRLESLQRVSRWALGSTRQYLTDHLAAHSGSPITQGASAAAIDLGPVGQQGADTYRFMLEVSVDTYTRWVDLCEDHWHQANRRVRDALDELERHSPVQTEFGYWMAGRANELVEVTAEQLVEGSKEAATAAVGEILSELPAEPVAKKSGSKRAAKAA
jgi:hypothetical protein